MKTVIENVNEEETMTEEKQANGASNTPGAGGGLWTSDEDAALALAVQRALDRAVQNGDDAGLTTDIVGQFRGLRAESNRSDKAIIARVYRDGGPEKFQSARAGSGVAAALGVDVPTARHKPPRLLPRGSAQHKESVRAAGRFMLRRLAGGGSWQMGQLSRNSQGCEQVARLLASGLVARDGKGFQDRSTSYRALDPGALVALAGDEEALAAWLWPPAASRRKREAAKPVRAEAAKKPTPKTRRKKARPTAGKALAARQAARIKDAVEIAEAGAENCRRAHLAAKTDALIDASDHAFLESLGAPGVRDKLVLERARLVVRGFELGLETPTTAWERLVEVLKERP